MFALCARRSVSSALCTWKNSKVVSEVFCVNVKRALANSIISDNLASNSGEARDTKHPEKKHRVGAAELLQHSVIKNEEDTISDGMWSRSAYPSHVHRDQSLKSARPKIDPRETYIVLFPGQGSQYIGMGQNVSHYPKAEELCDIASNYLGYDLLKLCLEGPKDKLDMTEYCQVAVFVMSLAAVERLKVERPAVIKNCVATAGFSIGEISALVFAGSLSFLEALKIVKIRADAMQAASHAISSGMMTVFYGPDSQLEQACLHAREWCLEYGIENPECRIANYLFPHCKVIAGHSEALKYIEANARQFKLRRLIRLPVSGAFHTNLMMTAVEPFKEALKKVKIEEPLFPVHSNVDALAYRDIRHIFHQLPKQIYKPVKWEQILHNLYERKVGENFPHTYEVGPGSTLKACLKNVNAKAWNSCVSIDV